LRTAQYSEWQPVTRDGPGAALTPDSMSGASGYGGAVGDGRRITVSSTSLYLSLPVNERWSSELGYTHDAVSGASPQYYADMTTAKQMTDVRRAADGKIVRWFERGSLSASIARSQESDYTSNAWAVAGTRSSTNQNLAFNVGIGGADDRITSNNGVVAGAARRKTETEIGAGCTCTTKDYLHINLQIARSRGYLSDPYKLYDWRPTMRDARVATLRWNHWLGRSALRTTYRSYRDTFEIRSRMLELSWVAPLGTGWTVTPGVRIYSQSEAAFFRGPASDGYPSPPRRPAYHSADQRLSAFGSVTASLKVDWMVWPGWQLNTKIDRYQQRSEWALSSHAGETRLPRLDAKALQLGITHTY
jgi:hypothetical protein